MEEIPCLCCGRFFLPRNREQQYCTLSVCQKARKRNWHYNKLQNDSDYRANQRLSQQKWLKDNPDYYQNYRTNHPEKSERNRVLQHIRNKRRRQLLPPTPTLIAKMDARTPLHLMWYKNEKANTGGRVMIRKKVIVPHLVRIVSGSFAFIPHRFLADGFLRSLSADELLLYFFLVLVSDKDGVSYYGTRKICGVLKMGCDKYEDARDRLIARGLVAYDDTFFQVLELPDKPVTDLPEKTGGWHA